MADVDVSVKRIEINGDTNSLVDITFMETDSPPEEEINKEIPNDPPMEVGTHQVSLSSASDASAVIS